MLCLSAILNQWYNGGTSWNVHKKTPLPHGFIVCTDKGVDYNRDLAVSLFPESGQDGLDSKMQSPALQWNGFIRLTPVS